MSFTPKQQIFIKEYLIDKNGTRAAIAAGYSEKSAYAMAHENLKNPKIRDAIQAELNKHLEKAEVTVERIIQELAAIAFVDIRRAFDDDGNLLPIREIPEDIARAIGGIDVSSSMIKGDEGEYKAEILKKLKLIDKKGALELLGKNLRMFIDKVEHTGKDGEDLFENVTDTDLARKVAFILTKPTENKEVH